VPVGTLYTSGLVIVPVPVSIYINLHKMVSMEEAEHKIELQFTISCRENERVSYLTRKNPP
jgi:hypothetical protein